MRQWRTLTAPVGEQRTTRDGVHYRLMSPALSSVFPMTPSSPSGESKRLRSPARYDVPDASLEEGFNRVIRLAARWLKVPVALVTLLDEEHRRLTFDGDLSLAETPREGAFCLDPLLGPGLLVVEDAATDPRFADHPLVTGTPVIRFYAGVPLMAPDDHVVGALCVIDTDPRRAETMDLDVLHDLAGIVVSELKLRAASEGPLRADRTPDAEPLASTAPPTP